MAFDPFVCPPPATLTPIPTDNCPINWDQVVRMLIGRKTTTAPFITTVGVNSILTNTKLLSYFAATDSTKWIATPLFGGMTFPKAEPKFEGLGDNLFPDGAGQMVAGDAVQVRAVFTGRSAATLSAIDKLAAEGSNLQAIFVNRFGSVIMRADGYGIDVISAGVSDMGSEGLGKPNQFDLILTLPFGWSRDTGMYQPTNYSARTIVPA